MNQNNHVCKTCGVEYYFCDYCGQQTSFTPYKSVCCSIECYSKYMDAVLEARGKLEPIVVKTIVPVIQEVVTENEITEEITEFTEIKTKRK